LGGDAPDGGYVRRSNLIDAGDRGALGRWRRALCWIFSHHWTPATQQSKICLFCGRQELTT
jgi:hypothetical protein